MVLSAKKTRYLMRAKIDDNTTKVFVVESINQAEAAETAQEMYPNAKSIITRRLYNPSLNNDKRYEEQQDSCDNNY